MSQNNNTVTQVPFEYARESNKLDRECLPSRDGGYIDREDVLIQNEPCNDSKTVQENFDQKGLGAKIQARIEKRNIGKSLNDLNRKSESNNPVVNRSKHIGDNIKSLELEYDSNKELTDEFQKKGTSGSLLPNKDKVFIDESCRPSSIVNMNMRKEKDKEPSLTRASIFNLGMNDNNNKVQFSQAKDNNEQKIELDLSNKNDSQMNLVLGSGEQSNKSNKKFESLSEARREYRLQKEKEKLNQGDQVNQQQYQVEKIDLQKASRVDQQKIDQASKQLLIQVDQLLADNGNNQKLSLEQQQDKVVIKPLHYDEGINDKENDNLSVNSLNTSMTSTNAKATQIILEDIGTFDQSQKCPKHPYEDIGFYCYTEEEPLCMKCVVEEANRHSAHNVQSIAKAKDHIQNKVKSIFQEIKSRIDDLTRDNNNLVNKKNEMSELIDQAKAIIRKHFEELINVIDKKKHELLESADQFFKDNLWENNNASTMIKDRINALNQLYVIIDNYSQTMNDNSFCSYVANKSKKIANFLNEEDFVKLDELTKADKIKCNVNHENLQKMIDSINQIKIEISLQRTIEIQPLNPTIVIKQMEPKLSNSAISNFSHQPELKFNNLIKETGHPQKSEQNNGTFGRNDQQKLGEFDRRSKNMTEIILNVGDISDKKRDMGSLSKSIDKNLIIDQHKHPSINEIQPFMTFDSIKHNMEESSRTNSRKVKNSPLKDTIKLLEKFGNSYVKNAASPVRSASQVIPSVTRDKILEGEALKGVSILEHLDNLRANALAITAAARKNENERHVSPPRITKSSPRISERLSPSRSAKFISPLTEKIPYMSMGKNSMMTQGLSTTLSSIKKARDKSYTEVVLMNTPSILKTSMSASSNNAKSPIKKVSTSVFNKISRSSRSNLSLNNEINYTNANKIAPYSILGLLGRQKAEFYNKGNSYLPFE